MSWSASGVTEPGNPPGSLEAVFKETKVFGGTEAPAETKEQVAAAKKAVKQLLTSGALGQPDCKYGYSFNLSGHANPGHEPRESGSGDSITLSVSRR